MRHWARHLAAGAFAAATACRVPHRGTARAADIPVVVAAADQSRADAATAGDVILVAWQDSSGTDPDIRAARVDSAGTVLDAGGFGVCTETGAQSWPAVASDGTGFLVAWQDERSGTPEIRAARVNADGTIPAADAGGFLVSDGSGAENYPDVAWTGSAYLVAWQDSRAADWDILAARVGADGVVQDAGASAIKVLGAGNQDAAAVAGNGAGGALVVYRDAGSDIKAALVDAAGVPSAPFGITPGTTSTQKAPAVAFGRGVYLVAWEDYRNCPVAPFYQDVYAARVSAAGALLDAEPHVPVAVDAATRSVLPAVGFDGGNFVVAWEDGPLDDARVRISRVIADANGVEVREPGGLVATSGAVDQDEPSVAHAGGSVLVAWADWRGADPADVYAALLGTNDPPVPAAGADIAVPWGADVTLDGGASSDPEGMPLAYSWTQVPAATVALSGAGTAMPTFTAPGADDTLTFEIEVSDGVWSATDQVAVTVASGAPDPPQPSDIQVENVTAFSVRVTWLTAPDAKGSVRYGPTPELGLESSQESSLSSAHDRLLEGLVKGKTYYYAVRSEGEQGAWTLSDVGTFVPVTPPVPAAGSSCAVPGGPGSAPPAAALAVAGLALASLARRRARRSGPAADVRTCARRSGRAADVRTCARRSGRAARGPTCALRT